MSDNDERSFEEKMHSNWKNRTGEDYSPQRMIECWPLTALSAGRRLSMRSIGRSPTLKLVTALRQSGPVQNAWPFAVSCARCMQR